jgi:hypothetical protein
MHSTLFAARFALAKLAPIGGDFVLQFAAGAADSGKFSRHS